MQKEQSAANHTLPNKVEIDSGRELLQLPATPSFSFDNANCVLDIEIQADQLLAYIDKLTSLADRACNTAIRQTETAQLLEKNRFAELGTLRIQLEQQKEQYHEQQLALLRVEHQSRAQISTLENRLHEIEKHQQNIGIDSELKKLQVENGVLATRLAAAEAIANQAHVGDHDSAPSNQEMADLKRQIAERDETIEIKNHAIKEIEREYRVKINELETRLSTVESELKIQEVKLKEKDSVIEMAGAKEAEVGNLIKRLSAECAALSGELQEKNQRLVEIQANKLKPISDVKVWRRMIGRLQEEPQ